MIVIDYNDKEINGEGKATTKNEIVYVPKTVYVDTAGNQVIEKTDLQINIHKTELNVKINGKNAVISKADKEQYLFFVYTGYLLGLLLYHLKILEIF